MVDFKKSITLSAGRHGLYLRLPKQLETQIVHRITGDGIGEDWSHAEHKGALSAFKIHNKKVHYDGSEADFPPEALVHGYCEKMEKMISEDNG